MRFKIGDRVKYVSRSYGDGPSNPLWGGIYGEILGTIVNIVNTRGSLPLKVNWDNGNHNGYDEKDLVLYEVIKLEDELFEI